MSDKKPRGKLYNKIGLFAAIPHSFIELGAAITNYEFRLFVYLTYKTTKDGSAYPDYQTIKQENGMTFNKIAKATRGLMEKGWLDRQKRAGASVVYTIKYPSQEPDHPDENNIETPDPPPHTPDQPSSSPTHLRRSAVLRKRVEPVLREHVEQSYANAKESPITPRLVRLDTPPSPPLESERLPPDQGVGVGSDASKTTFSFAVRSRYAESQSPPLGRGWLVESQSGVYDEVIGDWLAKQQADTAPGHPAQPGTATGSKPNLDPEQCPDCVGTGYWYPQGYAHGVQKCRHPKLYEAGDPSQE